MHKKKFRRKKKKKKSKRLNTKKYDKKECKYGSIHVWDGKSFNFNAMIWGKESGRCFNLTAFNDIFLFWGRRVLFYVSYSWGFFFSTIVQFHCRNLKHSHLYRSNVMRNVSLKSKMKFYFLLLLLVLLFDMVLTGNIYRKRKKYVYENM